MELNIPNIAKPQLNQINFSLLKGNGGRPLNYRLVVQDRAGTSWRKVGTCYQMSLASSFICSEIYMLVNRVQLNSEDLSYIIPGLAVIVLQSSSVIFCTTPGLCPFEIMISEVTQLVAHFRLLESNKYALRVTIDRYLSWQYKQEEIFKGKEYTVKSHFIWVCIAHMATLATCQSQIVSTKIFENQNRLDNLLGTHFSSMLISLRYSLSAAGGINVTRADISLRISCLLIAFRRPYRFFRTAMSDLAALIS